MSPDQDIRNRLLVARLPAIPQILLKLLELCQSEDTGMAELAKLIANDVGMTTRILDVANSAAYHRGGGRKVGLLQALSTLGADMIKTLVISESVLQTFNGFPHAGSSDQRSFWKHSLTTAVMAREIAKKMGYPQIEETYLAGLLHDVGRLALLAAAPNEYSLNFQAQDNENLCLVEHRTLQISHAEAGAWLIERWNLDSFMADSVLYHHEPTARIETAHPLIRMVHLAHWLSTHDPESPVPVDAGYLCNISDEDLLLICQGAAVQVKKAAAYLGIDLSGVDDLVATQASMPAAPAVSPAQQRLTEEVRNLTLLAELGQSFARQKDDIQLLDMIRQTARIMFNLENTIILLKNGSGRFLVGASVGQQHQRLAEFSVPLSGGGGIADAVLQGHLIFLDRGGLLSVAEEQLLRIFGAECLVCVPLAIGSRSLGVMVGGVPAWQLADMKRDQRFLQSFGTQAATALEATMQDRGEIDRRIAIIKKEHIESSRRVVHEVNNPLAIIKNYLSVLDEKLTRQEPVVEELSILNEEIDRVGSIVNEFIGTAPKAQEGVTDINRVVNDLVRLFRESRFLPASIQISTRMSAQPSEMDGPADTLKQILVNLIKNAVEALTEGGRIDIIHNGRIQRDGREFLVLSVQDNGPGMPADVLENLFSPVKSAKAGDNHGIGLSIVQMLVKKLNGLINCSSTSAGTSFEIFLPARDAAVHRAAPVQMTDTA